MAGPLVLLAALRHCLVTAMIVLLDFGRLVAVGVRTRRALAAENLFLRKQLALFQERKVKPRRADDSTRWMMATLSRMFEWRDALVERETGYAHPLASERLPLVLAMEIHSNGTTAAPKGPAPTHPRDGSRECDMG